MIDVILATSTLEAMAAIIVALLDSTEKCSNTDPEESQDELRANRIELVNVASLKVLEFDYGFRYRLQLVTISKVFYRKRLLLRGTPSSQRVP